MSEELKKTYKHLLEDLDLPEEFKESLLAFVETFRGDNLKETKLFLANVLALIYSMELPLIKSKAYDNIAISKKRLDAKLKEIDEDLDLLLKNQKLPSPAV
ncbi:MAG: hypothetical protein AAB443_04815 [Patescibacteria group bacterium]